MENELNETELNELREIFSLVDRVRHRLCNDINFMLMAILGWKWQYYQG